MSNQSKTFRFFLDLLLLLLFFGLLLLPFSSFSLFQVKDVKRANYIQVLGAQDAPKEDKEKSAPKSIPEKNRFYKVPAITRVVETEESTESTDSLR